MERYLIVAHGEDVDGIISAALMTRKIRKDDRNANIDYVFVSYSNQLISFIKLYEKVKIGSDGLHLIILDLNVNDGIRNLICNISLYCKDVMIFDHHSGTVENRDKLIACGNVSVSAYGYNSKISTSSMVYLEPLSGDFSSFVLSGIAQVSDYSETQCDIAEKKYGDDLQKIITLFNFLHESRDTHSLLVDLVRTLSVCINVFDELKYVIKLNDYARLREDAENVFKKSIDKVNIVLPTLRLEMFITAYAPSILPQKETLRYLRDKYRGKNYSGYFVIFDNPVNNVLFFKDHDSDFDATNFCSFMGGGGRDGDGGFSICEEVAIELFERIKGDIILSLTEYLGKNK